MNRQSTEDSQARGTKYPTCALYSVLHVQTLYDAVVIDTYDYKSI